LTTWLGILSAELTKHALFQTVFGDFAHWVIALKNVHISL